MRWLAWLQLPPRAGSRVLALAAACRTRCACACLLPPLAVIVRLFPLTHPPRATRPGPVTAPAVEEQLALVTSSGRPFELMDVRVVGEDGVDVPKDSASVGALPGRERRGCRLGARSGAACCCFSARPCTSSSDALNPPLMRPALFPSPQVGEVWVRGPTVFDGYRGLPAATADAFAPGGWFKCARAPLPVCSVGTEAWPRCAACR